MVALLSCTNTLQYTYPPPSEAPPVIITEMEKVQEPKLSETPSQQTPEPPAADKPQEVQIREEQSKISTPVLKASVERIQTLPVEPEPTYDIALRVTPQVKSCIDRFTGRDKKHFKVSLARMDKVRPVMEEIFDRKGIPRELVYLCLVESGANPCAVSRSGATGYWQFLPDTARKYGLQVNRRIDERKDLEKSTEAAAQYLKYLYSLFEDWPLAIAAYNAGEGAVQRIMKANDVCTFWDISRDMSIKPETLDYVPKFLATVAITRNRDKYGLPEPEPSSMRPGHDRNASFDRMARSSDMLQESISNPETELIADSLHPSARGSQLRSSQGRQSDMTRDSFIHTVHRGDTLYSIARKYSTTMDTIEQANGISREKSLSPGKVLIIPVEGAHETKQLRQEQTHTVAKGDTLEGISKKYGTSVDDIMQANRLKDARLIQPKMTLTIPASSSAKTSLTSPRATQYTVKKGDTLWGISRQFEVSAVELRRWNRLSQADRIKPGDELTIYNR